VTAVARIAGERKERTMKLLSSGRTRLLAGVSAIALAGGVGAATASTSSSMDMGAAHAMQMGHGHSSYGMTKAFYNGKAVSFTYSKGYFCDTSVSSKAPTGCEAGATFNKAPAPRFAPLYITVPLGFSVPQMSMDCPTGIVCVDHPGKIDLSRLEPALKPLYPGVSKKALTKTLSSTATPGHDHFITTKADGKPIWWDVKVVGVTKKSEYNKIAHHKSAKFLLHEVNAGKTTPVIPTNLFLFFAV
jgi:hypothetical protein